MSERWLTLWNDRSDREKRMLAVMLVLLTIVLVWLIARGVANAASDARTRHETAVSEHARIKDRIETLKQLRKRTISRPDAPLADFVSKSASDTGFILTKSEAMPEGRVAITIASARPTALFQWVGELERSGIVPETFVARANSDRTLSVDARFRGGGIE